MPATLLEKRLWHRHFPANFQKFLKTPFLQSTSGRLLLSEAAVHDNVAKFTGKYLYQSLFFL